ncbi:hypothetical protein ERJ75_000131700 [Trypanosoma vivax]|nr:hypothetical protein ERJ75_000131700 [Trypanosoma vivax]
MYLSLILICYLALVSHGVMSSDTRRNDPVVLSLRDSLKAAGVDPLPVPPRELGVHATCLKYGLSCDDRYVEFLKEELRKSLKSSPVPGHPEESLETPRKSTENSEDVGSSWEQRAHASAGDEVQLENLLRLRNVLRDQLTEQQSSRGFLRCEGSQLVAWFIHLIAEFHSAFVEQYWGFIMLRLFPCVLLTALLTWLFFGDRIPHEHLCGLLRDDPTLF